MIVEDILKADKIVVVGFPWAGKTELVNRIGDGREVIHTDAYIDRVPWKQQAEFFIELLKDKKRYFLEGIQGFRVLRTGLRDGNYKPDLIVYVRSTYPAKPKHLAVRKTLRCIWNEFLDMGGSEWPIVQLALADHRTAPKSQAAFGLSALGCEWAGAPSPIRRVA